MTFWPRTLFSFDRVLFVQFLSSRFPHLVPHPTVHLFKNRRFENVVSNVQKLDQNVSFNFNNFKRSLVSLDFGKSLKKDLESRGFSKNRGREYILWNRPSRNFPRDAIRGHRHLAHLADVAENRVKKLRRRCHFGAGALE